MALEDVPLFKSRLTYMTLSWFKIAVFVSAIILADTALTVLLVAPKMDNIIENQVKIITLINVKNAREEAIERAVENHTGKMLAIHMSAVCTDCHIRKEAPSGR